MTHHPSSIIHHLSSKIYHLSSKHSFTLMEIMIVVTLLIIIAIVGLVTLNPFTQINKANDAKRKSELTILKKVLEDWYNDKGCYPKVNQICYDSGTYNPVNLTTSCHICGSKPGSPSLSPYLNSVPCDPQQTNERQYLYEINDVNCPTLYKIYGKLSNSADSVITELGCQTACGPYGNCNYNYGVTSSNTGLIQCTAFATPTPGGGSGGNCSTYGTLYYMAGTGCTVCNSYANCQAIAPGQTYYIDAGGGGDPGCTQTCIPD